MDSQPNENLQTGLESTDFVVSKDPLKEQRQGFGFRPEFRIHTQCLRNLTVAVAQNLAIAWLSGGKLCTPF